MGEYLCEQMQVVVLMGGLGTRLQERTKDCPKPLVKIGEKPFFEYQLEIMRQMGFRKFVFCVEYRAEQIEMYFGNGGRFGVQIQYSYDGEKMLGTGGAIRKALPFLEENFLLIYGDSFMDINYFEAIVRYQQGVCAGKKALMTVMRNKNRFDKSNVIFRNGEIVLYDKKTRQNNMEHIDYGVNIFQKSLFEAYSENEIFDLSDLQNELSKQGVLAGCEVTRRFYEIGTLASLQEFSDYVSRRWKRSNQAVFLDRDGVINEIVWNDDIDQLDSPLTKSQFRLLPGVIGALKVIQEKGYLLFVVTNQPAAAKGKTSYAELCAINHSFFQELQANEIELSEIAMCPHYEKASPQTKEDYLVHPCDCRKPKPGLITHLTNKYNIDMEHSWMVGDSYTDIMCGKSAGLNTAFIGKYKCDLCMMAGCKKPDLFCSNLEEFAEGLPDA